MVGVEAPRPIRDLARVILGYYGFEPELNGRVASLHVHIDLGSSEDDVPPGLDPLAADWFGCRVFGSPAEIVAIRDRSRLVIDKEGQSATLTIDAQDEAALEASEPALFLFLTFALVHALQSKGRFILHGAAVCDEDGQGILILGESDTGKSTLTMSLIGQGWGYLSDDSLVITRAEEGLVAKPFRTDFGLDPIAEDFFPGVSDGAEPWLVGGDKWRVRIRELFPSLARSACRPRMIVFPEIDPASSSHLEPAHRMDAMARVMRQGSFLFSTDEHAAAKHQLDMFASLIGQCQLYRLVSGPDITRNAEILSHAFAPRLRGQRWPLQSKSGSLEA